MLNVIIWEKKFVSLETKRNHLNRYGERNDLVLSGIPDTVEAKDLEIFRY